MNKYIYVGNDQAAGPLSMDKPVKKYKGISRIGSATCGYCGRQSSSDLHQMEHYCVIDQWNEHLKTLHRIDIVGEHSFLDGQILEEGKDIEVRPDIYLPESYDEYLEAINEQARELPQRVTYVAIPLKQVQKEKDFEPGARNINDASLEEAAISHLETLYIKDYVRQRLKEPDWPLGWHQIVRAFEKGAEWAASQEVKGNATHQGKKLNIWLDDERPMIDPDMDLHCRTAEEVIELIKQNRVAFVSLDNDLGSGYTEGKKVAQFIEQAFGNGEIEFVDFHPHTANQVAWDEIMHCKRNVHKMLFKQWEKQKGV